MKNFIEWLEINHPESLQEGWGRNLMAAGLMGLASMGAVGCQGNHCSTANPTSAQRTVNDEGWNDVIGHYTLTQDGLMKDKNGDLYRFKGMNKFGKKMFQKQVGNQWVDLKPTL